MPEAAVPEGSSGRGAGGLCCSLARGGCQAGAKQRSLLALIQDAGALSETLLGIVCALDRLQLP